MKKSIRWMGIALASPFVLFVLLCILLYIPPIQNLLVGAATRYASEATGMNISIGRISLSFPLDLVVHQTSVTDGKDTILNAERLIVKVQMKPLLRKQVEVDGLELKGASVNTAGLIEGICLRGTLGSLFIASHGVALKPETATINQILLKDTHLSLSMADTTAADTTAPTPLYWRINLQQIDLENVSVAMQMPLDTLGFSLSLDKASLRDGVVDLRRSAYSARMFSLSGGKARYDSGTRPAANEGLDPSHIALTDINLSADSLYYAGNDIYANIRTFNLKERSGLEISSAEGKFLSDAKALSIPSLRLTTPDSYAEFSASMDWDAAEAEKDGAISVRLMADIGKNDLLKAITTLPEELKTQYPPAPLQLRAGIDGSLKDMRLTALSVHMPGIFSAQAEGEIAYPLDSIRRNGGILLAMEAGDLKFIESMTGGISLPQGMKADGEARINGSEFSANLQAFSGKAGHVRLAAGYGLTETSYFADLNIDSLNLHDFLPQDSLFELSASLKAEGRGTDPFHAATRARIQGEISRLRYSDRVFSGVGLEAELQNSRAKASLNVHDHAVDAAAHMDALLHPKQVKADMNIDIRHLDLQEMRLADNPFNPTLQAEAHLESDLNTTHKLRSTVRNIRFSMDGKEFKTKDFHAGFSMNPDSVRAYANAGDLTFLFKSADGLDKLTQNASLLAEQFAMQWQQKHINPKALMETMPPAQLKVFAGTDNPIANFLSASHVNYDRLRVDFQTSPQEGLNGNARLYGLRTDSLRLDTIYFSVQQDTARITFGSGVKALASKRQEAFDVSLQGHIASTDAQLGIEYLNGKHEQGVLLGINAFLHEGGISFHVAPDNPTLVYRTFKANKGNYVFLSDEGRIHANLRLIDGQHSGLSLYSTPDSLARQDLSLSLNRIDIAELRRIVPYMPDIAGLFSAEAHYIQTEKEMQVAAEMSIEKLAYDKQPLGNWAMSAVYLPKGTNEHSVDGFLTRNGEEIVSLNGTYLAAGRNKEDLLKARMQMHHFPLHVANAFVPNGMASLQGDLDGTVTASGPSSRPLLNGEIALDSVRVHIPQASLTLRMDNQPLSLHDSRLIFDRFNIFTGGKNPFSIDGYVDMSDFAAINMDLKMNARNFELLNARRTKESLVFGKLYVDFNSTVKGTPDAMAMRGNMNILGSSDFTYVLKDSPLTVEDRLNETVTFTDFADTATVERHDVQTLSLGGMDMLMTLHIDEAVQARVNLNDNGSNYMLLEGGGDLSFQYQPDGSMVLNGRYSLMSGEMKYEMPIIPLKTFHIQDGSFIEWTGNPMNPNLNIKAAERMRASVSSEGENTRTVNFDVGINLTNRLENLGFTFTLEAPDDGAMQNELAAMSAEERNKLAVTMLVTGMYMAESNSSGKSFDTNSVLNNFLQGEINKMAGNALKTIDINLGMETNEQGENGSSTDYTLQFAKRFWNNRIQVVIGGRVSTGNNAQQQEEAFIDNISLEYRLDNSGTRYIKIFHDKNYESVLDGEVIETGAGVVLRKKVSKLGELFIFRNRKKKPAEKETKE